MAMLVETSQVLLDFSESVGWEIEIGCERGLGAKVVLLEGLCRGSRRRCATAATSLVSSLPLSDNLPSVSDRQTTVFHHQLNYGHELKYHASKLCCLTECLADSDTIWPQRHDELVCSGPRGELRDCDAPFLELTATFSHSAYPFNKDRPPVMMQFIRYSRCLDPSRSVDRSRRVIARY
ncbi:hypothetical protein BP00DRAFT_223326 [Aspergillus indologenus CBS 114.80]|uniref:Uncharacterized protein n=1 Tax=Aspergillus indologenus CBS 114.80 TaxID=1450541 RepID=A0A2V5I422_9EURO|nr:hypothetical protein BP00DRAFT_223326 [Aspergillus indologenus CBS 114.80]